VAPPVFKSPSARVERLIGTVATIRAYLAMVWLRLRPRTMSRYVLLPIAGVVFHFSGAEICSRPSPEWASGLPESAECKGRRRCRSPAGATPRPLRTKMFFCGMLARWPSVAPFCREKLTRFPPSSYPFKNHAPQETFLCPCLVGLSARSVSIATNTLPLLLVGLFYLRIRVKTTQPAPDGGLSNCRASGPAAGNSGVGD
jgi:hypothetical protein